MTDNSSAAEDVTVTVGIKRWVLSDEDKLVALRKDLKAAGWFGAIQNFENVDGDKLQMNKGSQQIVAEVGDVVVSVNDTLSSLSIADYVSRYGPLPSTDTEGEST